MRFDIPMQPHKGGFRAIFVLSAALFTLLGCTTSDVGNNNVIRTVDVLESVRSQDLSARSPSDPNEAVRQLGGKRVQRTSGAIIYNGSGSAGLSGARPLFAGKTTQGAASIQRFFRFTMTI